MKETNTNTFDIEFRLGLDALDVQSKVKHILDNMHTHNSSQDSILESIIC